MAFAKFLLTWQRVLCYDKYVGGFSLSRQKCKGSKEPTWLGGSCFPSVKIHIPTKKKPTEIVFLYSCQESFAVV